MFLPENGEEMGEKHKKKLFFLILQLAFFKRRCRLKGIEGTNR